MSTIVKDPTEQFKVEFIESKTPLFLEFANFLVKIPKTPFLEPQTRRLSLFTSKPPPSFSFTAREVLELYKVDEKDKPRKKQIFEKLGQFLSAHLIHCPFKRTLSTISSLNTVMQPTPKGIKILEQWFYIHAREVDEKAKQTIVNILVSPCNTLHLVKLERDSKGDIQLTAGVAMIIWRYMIGLDPHIYGAKEPNVTPPHPLKVFNPNVIDLENLEIPNYRPQQSPYYQSGMTHPSSANICQYWSDTGVRVFNDLKFHIPPKNKISSSGEYSIPFVISGRALYQWICDCTTVENPKEARRVARFMISHRFIRLIEDPVLDAIAADPEDGHRGELSPGSLYRFTPRGKRLTEWEVLIDDEILDPRDVLLNDIHIQEKFKQSGIRKQRILALKQAETGKPMNIDFLSSSSSSILSGADRILKTSSRRGSLSSFCWDWENALIPKPEVKIMFAQVATLETVAADPALRYLFTRYVEGIHSPEIFRFFCASYQSLKGVGKDVFIAEGSPLELNISGSLRDRAMRADVNSPEYYDAICEIQDQCAITLYELLMTFVDWPALRYFSDMTLYCIHKYNLGFEL